MRPRGGTCRSSEGFRTGPESGKLCDFAAAILVTHPARCGRMAVKGRRALWVPDRPVTDPTAQGRWAGRGAGCGARPG